MFTVVRQLGRKAGGRKAHPYGRGGLDAVVFYTWNYMGTDIFDTDLDFDPGGLSVFEVDWRLRCMEFGRC